MNRTTIVALSAILVGCLTLSCHSAYGNPLQKTPPCYGNENFATQSALTTMVNAGLIPNFASIYRDEKNPYFLKTTLLDSEKVGKYLAKDFPESDVYKQIQKVTVHTKEGKSFEVLTVSETSFVECSLSEPAVMVISPEFHILSSGTSVLNTKVTSPPKQWKPK